MGSGREPTARARSLFSPLQFPTKATSLVSLVLTEQPLVTELPLVSPASCELRSVIRFLAAKKNSAKDIHTELCQVYGEGCMNSGMVRRWVREFKNGRTDVHDEPRAGRPSVSDDGYRLLGPKGPIVVRLFASGYNNQFRPVL
ncbi:hypothetical protein LAZ67_1004644 [Cordylochernes scorpioides]|uniref:Mos1 transposase HTH domain-containing protein n=1 Tax=Cordylochernes scorpioides TaxID=51811 RepID=A0ABY6JYE9_9ARAC|nr:hypothetical protein LAZ67_1004644 [Cordylochernes scorpioides]